MSNQFVFRFNRSSKYADFTVEQYEEHLKTLFIVYGFTDVVMVREYGDHYNEHWHGRFATSLNMRECRKLLNTHFELSGNAEISMKSLDPNRVGAYHRYMAKGPTGRRLAMPIVVIDDIGLLWETLHHAYHDEAVAYDARRRRGGAAKKPTFVEEMIEECRAKGLSTIDQMFAHFFDVFRRRRHLIDPYILNRIMWTVFTGVNPEKASEKLEHHVRGMNGSCFH